MDEFIGKLAGKLFAEFAPILRAHRVFSFGLMVIFFSPKVADILSYKALVGNFDALAKLLTASFLEIEVWKMLALGVGAFVAIPYVSAFIIRVCVSMHVRPAKRLFETLEKLARESPEEVSLRGFDQINALAERRARGLRRIERLKASSELAVAVALTLFLAVSLNPPHWQIALLLVAFGLVATLISRMILTTFLADIQPYEVIEKRRNEVLPRGRS